MNEIEKETFLNKTTEYIKQNSDNEFLKKALEKLSTSISFNEPIPDDIFKLLLNAQIYNEGNEPFEKNGNDDKARCKS